MALSFDRFALPDDLPLTPCAHCRTPVESTDSRGRCDDCACDPLLAGHDEVSTFDMRVALSLGALSFARRSAGEPKAPPTRRPSREPVAPPDLAFPSPPDVPDVAEPDLAFPSPPDLGDEDTAELNGWCDALCAAAIDHMEQRLPFELAWTEADSIVAREAA